MDWGASAVAGADSGGGTVTAGAGAAVEAAEVEEAAMELQWWGRVLLGFRGDLWRKKERSFDF